MIIGNNNVFEVRQYLQSNHIGKQTHTQVGSRTESLKIGDSNILEAKCTVGRHTNLSNGCIVGAGCCLMV